MPPLQEFSSVLFFPGDELLIDLIGLFKLPFYKNVLTGIDFYSKYFFAVPRQLPSAKFVACALVDVFLRHSHILATVMVDLHTAFTSRFHELPSSMTAEITNATFKHPKTIGVVDELACSLETHPQFQQKLTME